MNLIIYENILETFHKFGPQTTKDLATFNRIDAEIMAGDLTNEGEFKNIIKKLIAEGEEVTVMISSKLSRLKRIKGTDYLHGKN